MERTNAPGGVGDESNPKDFCKKQIAKGIEVELEHTDDESIALDIVMDHLEENPNYYDHLEDMESSMDKSSFISADNITDLIKNSGDLK